MIHLDPTEFTAQEHAEGCPQRPEDVDTAYGMAGGGMGIYSLCTVCGAILSKSLDDEGDDDAE